MNRPDPAVDRIEQRTALRAPLARVWAALTESDQYGRWFGSEFAGPFTEGAAVAARMVPTEVDPAIAAQQASFRGQEWTMHVVTIEPMSRFVFRWDASDGVLTTVTFTLAERDEGVELTVVEEGFAALPDDVRDAKREVNTGGWAAQLGLVARFLER